MGEEVTTAIKDYKRATGSGEQELPQIIEHPIDDKIQTGESRLLGGFMEIKAPWRRD